MFLKFDLDFFKWWRLRVFEIKDKKKKRQFEKKGELIPFEIKNKAVTCLDKMRERKYSIKKENTHISDEKLR